MRQEHLLAGAEDFGRLGHEMHAAKDDALGIRLGGFHGQPERITGEVGQVLDRRNLVIVREDDRIFLAAQVVDLGNELLGGQVAVVLPSGWGDRL